MFSKLQFSKFNKFVSRSVFEELQLTQMSLNFKTCYRNLKIRGLGAKLCGGFLIFLFLNGIVTFWSQRFDAFCWTKIYTVQTLIKTKRNREMNLGLICLISVYSALNTLSEYTYFYITQNITTYTFLLVFKIIESLQIRNLWSKEVSKPDLIKRFGWVRRIQKVPAMS